MVMTKLSDIPEWQKVLEKIKAQDARTPLPVENCDCGLVKEHNPERMVPGQMYCDGQRRMQVFLDKQRKYLRVKCDVIGVDSNGKEILKVQACPKRKTDDQARQPDPAMPSFANFDSTLQATAFNFCVGWKPAGREKLILRGEPGLGKTHLARAMYYKFLSEPLHLNCSWIDFAELEKMFQIMESFSENFDLQAQAEDRYAKILRDDVIFIDDLGKERSTQSGVFKERLHSLLDKANGALVITTEMDSGAMTIRYGQAIVSRLQENCQVLWFRGEDYRKHTMKPVLK